MIVITSSTIPLCKQSNKFGNPINQRLQKQFMPNNTLKNILQKKPVHCSYECYWCIYVNTYHVHYSITKIKDTLIKQCNTRSEHRNLYDWHKCTLLWTGYCVISMYDIRSGTTAIYIIVLTIEIMPWRSFKSVHNAKIFFREFGVR